MHRRPLLFGTPATPCPSACGSLVHFSIADAAFPPLPHRGLPMASPNSVSSTSSSMSSFTYSADVAVRRMEPAFAHVLGATSQPTRPSLPCTIPSTTMTRSENRLEMAICNLDDKLEKFQYEGAKHILSNLLASTRDAWLKKLHHSLKHNVPMVTPTPPAKQYYKTRFRPIFTDAVPLTYADSTRGPTADDAFRAPMFRRYSIWTDRALATYASMDFSAAFFQQKRRKVCRPSSQVHLRHRLPIPGLCSTTSDVTTIPWVTPQQKSSLHVFQFATHSSQHASYCKTLLDKDTNMFGYLITKIPRTPQDTKGYHRTLQQSMFSQLDARLKYGLATTPIEHWDALTSSLFASWKICSSLKPTTERHETTDGKDTHPTLHRDYPIGLGISHFSPKHRLHRRVHRAQCFFELQQIQQWSIQCAPGSRQHLDTISDVQLVGRNLSALIFQQHSSSFNSPRIPLLGSIEDSQSPVYISFVGDDFLKFPRAPTFRLHGTFAQHRDTFIPLFTFLDSNAPQFRQHNQVSSYDSIQFPSPILCAPLLRQHLIGYGSLISTLETTVHTGNPVDTHCGISNPSLFPYVPSLSFTHLRTGFSCLGKLCDTFSLGIFRQLFFPCNNSCKLSRGSNHSKTPRKTCDQNESRGQKKDEETEFPLGPGLWSCSTSNLDRPLRPPLASVVSSRHGSSFSNFDSTQTLAMTLAGPFWSYNYVEHPSLAIWTRELNLPQDAGLVQTIPPRQCTQLPALLHDASAQPDIALPFSETTGTLLDLSSSSDESFATSCSSVQTSVSEYSELAVSSAPTIFVQPPLADSLPIPTSPPHVENSIASLPSKIIQPLNNFSGLFSSHLHTLFDQYQMNCTVDDSLYGWVLRILSSNNAHGVFYHNSHWYPYVQLCSEIHLVLPSTHNLTLITFLYELLHTLQPSPPLFYYYQSPPTPHGLCGLSAVHILRWALHSPSADALSLGIDYRGFYWADPSAIYLLFSQHRGLLDFTSKHFLFGPSGLMKSHSSTSSVSDNDEPPHPFDFRTVQQPHPELYPHPLIDVPLSSPDLPQTPITISLYPDDQELAQQDNLTAYLNRFIVYCHIAQTLQFQSFTITPQQSFIHQWQNQFPGYNSTLIDVILVWNSHHSTWVRTDFAEIESTITKARTGTCHLRIVFHSKDIHVAFPLLKRIFNITILPTFTTTQITSQIALLLGDSTRRILLTQNGRVLDNRFNLWLAPPNFIAQIEISHVARITASYQGRQSSPQIQFCTCHTWCDTTQTLTKRFQGQRDFSHLACCIFRHPHTNYLYFLPICPTTTPAHVHTKFLPPHSIYWLPMINNTIVSMDTPLTQYGRMVVLELHELPSTLNIRTETLWGQSIFHHNIQEPTALSHRPLRRLYIDALYPADKPPVPFLTEPYFLVQELEDHLDAFLRLNQDILRPPYPQHHHTFVKDSTIVNYSVQSTDDPYVIRRNLYNHTYPQTAIRPYPINPNYWTISDQFSTFLLPVLKTVDYTFLDAFYEALPLTLRDNFETIYIQAVIFQNEQYNLQDTIPQLQGERIVYLLKPAFLDIYLQESNTHCQYTVSPLTQVSQLKQIIETYLHISKHHIIIPAADTDCVTSLPFPLYIGFPPHDHSDNATHASHLTDYTSTTSTYTIPHRPALQDEFSTFHTIPKKYWFTNLDFESLAKLICPRNILWVPTLEFVNGNASHYPHFSLLACFVYANHWYAVYYQPPSDDQGSFGITTLFTSPNTTTNQHNLLISFLTPLLPNCVFQSTYVPDTTVGLCGPSLTQTLVNFFITHLKPPPTDPVCHYCSFDFSQESLFQQAYEIRLKYPSHPQTGHFQGGALDSLAPTISPTLLPTFPTTLLLQDDPTQFGHIPLLYWFNDIDMGFLLSLICSDDLLWVPTSAFLHDDFLPHPQKPFLTAFTFHNHWYAAYYRPISHIASIPTTTLFIPCTLTPNQLTNLVLYISHRIPPCTFSTHSLPQVAPGLCGPALVQGVMNWLLSQSPSLTLSQRIEPYRSYDFSQNSLFCQAYDLRKRLPHSHTTSQYCAGMHPTIPPTTSSNPIGSHVNPPNTPTTYELVRACEEEESQHPLLSATALPQFPVRMRNLTRRSLPPSIPILAHLELLDHLQPSPPPSHMTHTVFYSHETVWRKNIILPLGFTHSQRIQCALPGLRRTLYDKLDIYVGGEWKQIFDFDTTIDTESIHYRFQFKKFLIPIHIHESKHAFLLEVWPWYTIADVAQNFQNLFHLAFGKVQCLDHPFHRPLTTIQSRKMLTYSIRTPTYTIQCPPGFTFPPESFHRPLCWCQTVCQFTLMAQVTSQRIQQQLFHNLVPVILPSRQCIFVPLCTKGSFRVLLYYLLPSAQHTGQYIALANTKVYSLDDFLPERHNVSYIYFLIVPRGLQCLPSIDTHLFLFRTMCSTEYQHPDLCAIEVIWESTTYDRPLTRTIFTLRSYTIGDLHVTLEQFCGPEYCIKTQPDLEHTSPITNFPVTPIFTITPLRAQDPRPIHNLTLQFQDHLEELPEHQWFTDQDLLHFQVQIRRQYPNLAPIKAHPLEAILLQPLDTSWATATIHLNTWLPLYYDHVLATLIVGLPQAWCTRTNAEVLDPLRNTFQHAIVRPLPSAPEGWCGPLAVCTLFYWIGYQQEHSPLRQLKDTFTEAINRPNRTLENTEAVLRAGGPTKRTHSQSSSSNFIQPAPLSQAMMNQAILKTFFGLTRTPQPYQFLGADIPHRILYLAKYDFLDYDPSSTCYYQLSFRGLPTTIFLVPSSGSPSLLSNYLCYPAKICLLMPFT